MHDIKIEKTKAPKKTLNPFFIDMNILPTQLLTLLRPAHQRSSNWWVSLTFVLLSLFMIINFKIVNIYLNLRPTFQHPFQSYFSN